MSDLTMQTRSKTCRRSKSGPCKRLTGHKGACRPTLTKAEGRMDRNTVRPEVEAAIVAVEQAVAKALKGRKASRPKVRNLPTAGPEGRDVQRVGRAKRAKAAPQGTKSRSNANALKGRI